MRAIKLIVYVGPTVHALVPVVRVDLNLGAAAGCRTMHLGPQLPERILQILPVLRETEEWADPNAGFRRRMTDGEGVTLGEVVARVAVDLQRLGGAEVSFAAAEPAGPDVENVFYQYEERRPGVLAGRLAMALVNRALPEDLRAGENVAAEADLARSSAELIRSMRRGALDQTTVALARTAKARGIPWFRLSERDRIVQLGHGRFQKRIRETITSDTGMLGVQLVRDKSLTNTLLSGIGVPVALQSLVDRPNRAAAAAQRIGFPVVVKPSASDKGKGITIGANTDADVHRAFARARRYSSLVVVEKFVPGDDHRILVVNGRMVAASRRIPGHVVGDGKHTIRELVEAVNRDPRRGVGFTKPLNRLELDEVADDLLRGKGYTHDSVPPEGETVYLRRTANISTGGTAVDVTREVHPDIRAAAVRAVAALGLNIAGVDYITTDIGRSYKEIGGVVCEVNCSPGLRPHWVALGEPPDVNAAVVDALFPPESNHHVPIAAVTGTNGKTTTVRMVAHVLSQAGYTVGMATTNGAYIAGEQIVAGDMAGHGGARRVLRDPYIDAAVLETARGGIFNFGLGFEVCNVGAVLGVGRDHLGQDGIETVEELARVKSLVAQVARECAVLNADDERCVAMAQGQRAKRICFVTTDPANPVVAKHVRAGGPAVVLKDGQGGPTITLNDGGRERPVLPAAAIPATLEGRAAHNVQNALFATAIAVGLGRSTDEIGAALASFAATAEANPGRLNVYDGLPFKVILDYAHNAEGVETMCRFLSGLDVAGRRLCMIGAPGNRGNAHFAEMGRAAAGAFDAYVCYDRDNRRGRRPGEVAGLLADAIVANGVAKESVERIAKRREALARLLRMAVPGDLVVVFAHDTAACWAEITAFDPGDMAESATPTKGPHRAAADADPS